MSEDNSIEIARQDGEEFRSVRLRIEGGGIVMDAQDMGPIVKRTWDHEDYEFGMRLAPDAVARLAFELLKDKFTGDTGAVDKLRAYCKERGIEHKWESWP